MDFKQLYFVQHLMDDFSLPLESPFPPPSPPSPPSPPQPPSLITGNTCDDPILMTMNTYVTINTSSIFTASGVNDVSTCAPYDDITTFGGAMGTDVWFKISPTTAWSFTTCNPQSYDTNVIIYTGTCNDLTTYYCNGDAPNSNNAGACQSWYSANVATLEAGEYLIQIGSYEGSQTGILRLAVTEVDGSTPPYPPHPPSSPPSPPGSSTCASCVYDWSDYGSECCDTAWEDFGLPCAVLETQYQWDCTGCTCPGDT